jgi:hypothetical protein
MSRPALTLRKNALLGSLVFLVTLAMTYLTYAKELVLFQNERGLGLRLIYLVATRAYYPLLAIHSLILYGAIAYVWKRGRFPILLGISVGLFLLNLLLFSSNNLLNLIQGQPLHRWHQGIGR